MQAIIQSTPAWQLDVTITPTRYGQHLLISSLVPTARRPTHHVQFSGTFSKEELRTLRDAIDQSLLEAA